MWVLIIGDTGLPDLPAGRVIDLPDDLACRLVTEGYARPLTRQEREHRFRETRGNVPGEYHG